MAFPSPAMDYKEEMISLDRHIIRNPTSTFMMEADSLAMVGIGIYPKTILVIDRSLTPKSGDVIVAAVQGEYQVRFLKKNQFKGWLCPANRTMKEVQITPEMDVQVFGVVISYITDPRNVQYVFAG